MTISDTDISALLITLKLAIITTLILLVFGTPLAWWLARTRCRFKFLVEAVVALPLVLPPTVLGFYLLIALSANGPVGKILQLLGGKTPAFTFAGLVIGSVIYSMPFVIQPLQNAFHAIGQRPLEVAATLRASPLDSFFSIVIPQATPAFLTAAVLGFAHTIGEFGVVLMIGGNIPGKTQVISIAVYDHVEALEYSRAHTLSGLLLIISFILLMLVYGLRRDFKGLQA